MAAGGVQAVQPQRGRGGRGGAAGQETPAGTQGELWLVEAGHVTPVLASDWSPCPGSVRHHPGAGLHLRPHPGRPQPPGLPGQLFNVVKCWGHNLFVVKYSPSPGAGCPRCPAEHPGRRGDAPLLLPQHRGQHRGGHQVIILCSDWLLVTILPSYWSRWRRWRTVRRVRRDTVRSTRLSLASACIQEQVRDNRIQISETIGSFIHGSFIIADVAEAPGPAG